MQFPSLNLFHYKFIFVYIIFNYYIIFNQLERDILIILYITLHLVHKSQTWSNYSLSFSPLWLVPTPLSLSHSILLLLLLIFSSPFAHIEALLKAAQEQEEIKYNFTKISYIIFLFPFLLISKLFLIH